MFSRGPNSQRRADIAAREETMVDELNKLEEDPSTGLPVLSRLKSDRDILLAEKETGVGALTNKATTEKDKIFAKLYKSGVTTHGKITGLQRDLSEGFSTDLNKVLNKFTKDTGDIEDTALTDLQGIRESITSAENLYKTTDTMEGDFPGERYETTLTPGQKSTKPLEVKEDMYKYDYITGLKDLLNENA